MSKTEDAYQAALSAFNHHIQGCQCCDRYTGKSSDLGLLCEKGARLWKLQDDAFQEAKKWADRRRWADQVKASHRAVRT